MVCDSLSLSLQVVVTVPLSVLKAGHIQFSPPLGDRKSAAITRLGAGLVEKASPHLYHAACRVSNL